MMIYTSKEKNVRIVPFEREKHMTEQYRQWMNCPETTQFNSWGLFPYTRAQQKAFAHDIEEGSESRIVWAIEVKLSDTERKQGRGNFMPLPPDTYARIAYGWKHVGNCTTQKIDFINRSCEYAVVIGESEARGKGIGTQVCKWACEHAFLKLGMHRIWSGTASVNIPMQRVFGKCGFKKEGTFRQGMFLNGKFIDVITYGLLFNEWESSNGASDT